MSAASPVIMGSAAPAAVEVLRPETVPAGQAQAPESDYRLVVLNALAEAGHRSVASMLEAGEWKLQGNEVLIAVSASATLVDMTLGADARRLAIATASGALGRAVKLKIIPGAVPLAAGAKLPAVHGSGRTRAEQEPVVRRMKEKFGAEIRTIIDYKNGR